MRYLQKSCNSNNKKIYVLFAAATAIFIAAGIFSIIFGSTHIKISEIIGALTNGASGASQRIIWYVRLPRTLGSLLVGASLSVAGALIQSVFANKLATPGIIGVNSGAGLAVTICAVLGIYGGWQLALWAFAGAFAAVLFVSQSARHFGASRGTVILIGVALNSILNAFSDAIITFNPDISIMSNDFKIGDFSAVSYQKLIPAAVIIIVSLIVLFTLVNELDVMTLGEENAVGLGLNVRRMRAVFLIIVALLAGSAVSLAGLVSFVGLIVPHAVRKFGVTQAKHLLPLCALFGGGFVTICDTLARTIFSPYEIPVGIIMAVTGAPVFVIILIKGKGGHARD